MINYEIKSQLAKLLPPKTWWLRTETSRRPPLMWRPVFSPSPCGSWLNTVYDMLVGHEVGHALYTPDQWDFLGKIPKAFVNVTEDARIEKLMKRRYPGLAKTFYRGYSELNQTDFFGIKDQDISEMTLADRVNLHYKIGSFITVPFTDEEQEIVDLIGKSETFDDALHAAEVMYKFVGESLTDQKPLQDQEQNEFQQGESEQTEQQPTSEKEQTGEGEPSEEFDQEPQSQSESSDPFEVSTDEAFSDGH